MKNILAIALLACTAVALPVTPERRDIDSYDTTAWWGKKRDVDSYDTTAWWGKRDIDSYDTTAWWGKEKREPEA